jgi:hypothetical protein
MNRGNERVSAVAQRGSRDQLTRLEGRDEKTCRTLLGLLTESQRNAVESVLLGEEVIDNLQTAACRLRTDQRTLGNLLRAALSAAEEAVGSNQALQGQGLRKKLRSLRARLDLLTSPPKRSLPRRN